MSKGKKITKCPKCGIERVVAARKRIIFCECGQEYDSFTQPKFVKPKADIISNEAAQ